MDETWRETGRVRSVNPRTRELRVAIRPGLGYVFTGLEWIQFQETPGRPLRCKVASIKSDDSVAVVALAPGVSRDIVGRLKGVKVVVALEEWPARPGTGWRLADLLGMTVVQSSGEVLGTVCEVYEGPANDAFAVARPDGTRCILPAIDAVMVSVDSETATISTGDVSPFIVEA
jgi:ribosomal 30S subunit maturation factor RimM